MEDREPEETEPPRDASRMVVVMRRWLPYVFLAALPFLAFWRLWTPNERDRVFIWMDVVDVIYPCLVFVRDAFVHYHEVPKWAWGIYTGIPFTANLVNLIGYPVNWLFAIVDPAGPRVFHLYLIAHLSAAGISCYAFARSFDYSRVVAILGASIYALCGFTLYIMLVGPSWGATYALLPLILLCVRRFVLEERLLWVAAYAGALAFAVGSLMPLLLVPAAYCIGAFLVVSLFVEGKRHRAVSFVLWIGAATLLAFAVQATELLPLWEASKSGNGFGVQDFIYARDKWGVETAATFLKEYVLGGDSTAPYLGTLGGAAALVGLAAGRSRYWGFWAGLFVAMVLAFFCSGDFSLYSGFYGVVPLIGKLPSLGRGGAGALFVLSGVFLAMDAMQACSTWRPRSAMATMFGLAVVAAGLAALVWIVAAPSGAPALSVFRRALAAWALSVGLMILLAGAAWSAPNRRVALKLAALLFLIDTTSIVVKDFEVRVIPWRNRHVPQEFDGAVASNSAAILLESPYLRGRSEPKLPSMAQKRIARQRDMDALIQGADSVAGYYPWLPRRTVQAFKASDFTDSYLFRMPQSDGFDPDVRWTETTVRGLYDLRGGRGRAWLVPTAYEVGGPPLYLVARSDFDPGSVAYLEDEQEVLRSEFGGSVARVERLVGSLVPGQRPRIADAPLASLSPGVSLIRQTVNTVTFRVDRPTNGEALIFSDAWYPGWTAYVNGARVPLYVADYLFKGVRLNAPAGTQVEFVFTAPLFTIGAAISTAAVATLVTLAVAFRRRRLRP